MSDSELELWDKIVSQQLCSGYVVSRAIATAKAVINARREAYHSNKEGEPPMRAEDQR
jgi:hypothetical protein